MNPDVFSDQLARLSVLLDNPQTVVNRDLASRIRNVIEQLLANLKDPSLDLNERTQAIREALLILKKVYRLRDQFLQLSEPNEISPFPQNLMLFVGNKLRELTDLPEEERDVLRKVLLESFNDVDIDFLQTMFDSLEVESISRLMGIYTLEEWSKKIQDNRFALIDQLNEERFDQISPELIERIHLSLTKDLFPHSERGFRQRHVLFSGRIGTPPDKLDDTISRWCNDVNILLKSNLSAYEFNSRLASKVIEFINIHPFPDWNVTSIMIIALIITRIRTPSKEIIFIPNNMEMFKYIFSNNLIVIRGLLIDLLRSKIINSESAVRSTTGFILNKLPPQISDIAILQRMARELSARLLKV